MGNQHRPSMIIAEEMLNLKIKSSDRNFWQNQRVVLNYDVFLPKQNGTLVPFYKLFRDQKERIKYWKLMKTFNR